MMLSPLIIVINKGHKKGEVPLELEKKYEKKMYGSIINTIKRYKRKEFINQGTCHEKPKSLIHC